VATCLLMYAGLSTVHPRYRRRYHVWSSNLLHVGVLLVIATFAFGVHLTLRPLPAGRKPGRRRVRHGVRVRGLRAPGHDLVARGAGDRGPYGRGSG